MSRLLQVVFADHRNRGMVDLEAVEMLVRARAVVPANIAGIG